jgi:hypothetical protein
MAGDSAVARSRRGRSRSSLPAALNRQRNGSKDGDCGHQERDAPPTPPLARERVLDHTPTYRGPPSRHDARYYD